MLQEVVFAMQCTSNPQHTTGVVGSSSKSIDSTLMVKMEWDREECSFKSVQAVLRRSILESKILKVCGANWLGCSGEGKQ